MLVTVCPTHSNISGQDIEALQMMVFRARGGAHLHANGVA